MLIDVRPRIAWLLGGEQFLVIEVLGISQYDRLVPVVPMFHANAWGMPFGAIMVGAKFVMPGPHLDLSLIHI